MGVIVFAITRKQQQRASQPLLGGIEELIDQILLKPNVPRKHVGNEEGSASACSSWRTRLISFFSIARRVVGTTAVAVPIRIG